MRNRIKFIIIMVMAIVCTMTANAQEKDVYFATHRFVQDEYGETQPKNLDYAYCPTRIEVDKDAKTLLVKSKAHGVASYPFSKFDATEKSVFFYGTKGEKIAIMVFYSTTQNAFNKLIIYQSDDTIEIYEQNCYKFDYQSYCRWREFVNLDFKETFIDGHSNLYKSYFHYQYRK